MELQTIVDRYAEGLAAVDASTAVQKFNQRTGAAYPVSVKSLGEREAVAAVDDWWALTYPQEFTPPPNMHAVPYAYPGLQGAECDHAFTTDSLGGAPEWAIEVKKPELIGNNGKRNDYVVAKMLSPYLKDRGLLHDVVRLRDQGLGRRRAVLGYSFNYDAASCAVARRLHPADVATIREIEKVVALNDGSLTIEPLLAFCNGILHTRNLVVGGMARANFQAWRGPYAGEGIVFAWEISDAPGPRHPW
ncbi:hypothetical protein [Cellulomonas xylanilytica]|uniref:hypothetical protein n=1 Tax=Cellulomonas xylanilytica TaxID=233583 RepID=UPI000A7ED26D|nr:hypothetical protein [Cellulomonas xylanilytica]